MIEGILIGLETAFSLKNLMMVMIGCFAGTIIGMLPGLGPMTAIALMIPITYGFEPSTGLMPQEFLELLLHHSMAIQWLNKGKLEKR